MGDKSMEALKSLEDQLVTVFKDLPELPKGIKDALVQWWPYIALALGILQLLAAIALFGLVTAASVVITYAGAVTGTAYSGLSLIAAYAGIALLVVDAVIFFMAFSPLTKKLKRGWDLLFLSTIINVVYGISQVFIGYRGVGSLLGSLVGTAVGLYLLFQIRDRYTSKKVAKAASDKPEALK